MYSGPIAAHAYSLLRGRDIEVAVLVGPSHYVGFEAWRFTSGAHSRRRSGPCPIAEECAAAMAMASRQIKSHPTAHVREHSLEMQLPFLKRVLPDVDDRAARHGPSAARNRVRARRRDRRGREGAQAVLVASTDLSHYQNAATAAKLDGKVIQQVQRFDADGLMSLLEAFPEHACGGGPTVSVMRAAKLLGATDARVLKYGDSGDVSGDKDAVVGYLAAAFGTFCRAADH